MASRRIFLDIEEAIAREVRRITHHDSRTLDKVIMRETYDPFSGEVVLTPVEPEFYDSSADAGVVQYPHFFIRLLKTREDRFTGRVISQYGKWIKSPIITSPKAFEIVLTGSGLISAAGNQFTTSSFQIRKVEPGHLLRLIEGNNVGTYIVDSITISNLGDHTIFVSTILVKNLQNFIYDPITRKIVFKNNIDLNTVEIGDIFVDSTNTSFPITTVNANQGSIIIGGSGNPSTLAGAKITRIGNVFKNTDLSQVKFLILDPDKPIKVAGIYGDSEGTSAFTGTSPSIPLDAYYLVRIDSKTRENHIDILNRVWEEFNPPRTALPVIVRSALSADQLLKADVPIGGSDTIQVEDNSNYNVGDPIFLIDDFSPTKRFDGKGFQRPFESKVKSKISTNILVLEDIVPDTYKINNCTRVVSNAEFNLYMFHFVDHVTKDVEGSQYWVHEFTFWVQLFVDRLETVDETGVITDTAIDIEDIDTGNIISDE